MEVSPSGGGASASAPTVPTFAFKLITFTVYDDVPANKDKLFAKIEEFNASSTPSLSESDLSAVSACLLTLCATSHYHSTSVPEAQVSIVMKMSGWDTTKQFPFFDLMRLIAVHPEGSNTLSRSVHTKVLVETA